MERSSLQPPFTPTCQITRLVHFFQYGEDKLQKAKGAQAHCGAQLTHAKTKPELKTKVLDVPTTPSASD